MKHFQDDTSSEIDDYEFNTFSHWKDEETKQDDYNYGTMSHLCDDYDPMKEYETHIGCNYKEDY